MKTRVTFVLDESGSMGVVQKATRDGFDEYVQDLKKEDTDIVVSVVKFSSHVVEQFMNVPISSVGSLTNYHPGGSTALYDGIMYAVRDAERTAGPDDRVQVIVMTDGYENSSREANREQVLDTITAKEATGKWEFTYVGANQDAWATGASIGVQQRNAVNFVADAAHTVGTFSSLAGKTRRYAGGQNSAFTADERRSTGESV